jgi:hypothetical protein
VKHALAAAYVTPITSRFNRLQHLDMLDVAGETRRRDWFAFHRASRVSSLFLSGPTETPGPGPNGRSWVSSSFTSAINAPLDTVREYVVWCKLRTVVPTPLKIIMKSRHLWAFEKKKILVIGHSRFAVMPISAKYFQSS